MKVVSVANQKGGVGKTMIARHLAHFGLEKGLKVLAVDVDLQQNFTVSCLAQAGFDESYEAPDSSGAHNLFLSSPPEPLVCGAAFNLIPATNNLLFVGDEISKLAEALYRNLSSFDDVYDICIIDTSPSVSHVLLAVLAVSDFVVCPFTPDRDALHGLSALFAQINQIKSKGENAGPEDCFVVVNRLRNLTAHKRIIQEIKEGWGGLVVRPAINDRYAVDVAKDRPVWRTEYGNMSKLPAGAEILEVCKVIYQRIGA